MTHTVQAARVGVAAPAVPRSPGGRRPVDLRAVRLLPTGVLGRWQQRNGEVTLPHCIEQLESSGVLDNLRRVAGDVDPELVPYRGFVFADSDLYKVIEAVAWEIARSGTTAFDGWLDSVIALVGRAQDDDGYVMSAVQGGTIRRWEKLDHAHEMYVLGHLVQAAVALDRACGRRDLLELSLRFVELLDQTFGPQAGRRGICGHPEIETALVELHRHTGDRRHLELAAHLIDLRGTELLPRPSFGSHYFQDHQPVRAARTVAGHAVRQLYLAAGVTDLYLETGEPALIEALRAQWDDAHGRKMYISGAFGSRHRDEAFGSAYELPPDRAYAETCATIGDLHWSWRMLLADGDARYAEVIEREVYNALAASVDGTGSRFFYSNPLQSRPDKQSEENAPRDRAEWYACACCPPNIARCFAQLSAYVVTVSEVELTIHLVTDADIDIPEHLGGGVLRMRTSYPSDGTVTLTIEHNAGRDAQLAVRVPSWSVGTNVEGRGPDTDGYLRLDLVETSYRFDLDVTPRWTSAHPRVDAVRGCVALECGPLLYAVEEADLPADVQLQDIQFDATPVHWHGDDVTLSGHVGSPAPGLYHPYERIAPTTRSLAVRAIPFHSWGNRTPGAMRVWLPLALT